MVFLAQWILIALLAMTGVSVILFAIDRWLVRPPGEQSRGVRALFANPFLKVAAILLLVMIVVGDYNGNLSWLVVGAIAATVAGADFVLLFMAILRGNTTFIQEFFQTERIRYQQSARESAALWQEATKQRMTAGVQGVVGRRRAPNRAEVEAAMEHGSGQVSILWVDDDPKGNQMEVAAFREMNFGVDMRTTNEAAKVAYLRKHYDVIISDIDRTPTESSAAGLDLPDILENADPDRPLPPIVYYVHKVDAMITDLGHPVVNTPAALLEAVVGALRLGDRR